MWLPVLLSRASTISAKLIIISSCMSVMRSAAFSSLMMKSTESLQVLVSALYRYSISSSVVMLRESSSWMLLTLLCSRL